MPSPTLYSHVNSEARVLVPYLCKLSLCHGPAGGRPGAPQPRLESGIMSFEFDSPGCGTWKESFADTIFAIMDVCTTCHKPLILEIESEDDDDSTHSEASSKSDTGRTVPDSVELTCGCHFHWSVPVGAFAIHHSD